MKISIITVTLNNKSGLKRAIESVRNQTYKNVEHIIVDGGSTDGSVEAVNNLQFTTLKSQSSMYSVRFLSEPDDGIYDAINKGIKLATGDVIGLLHSDDFYATEYVLESYAKVFTESAESKVNSEPQQPITPYPVIIDAVYSDLVYVKSKMREEKRRDDNLESAEHFATGTKYSVIRMWKTQKADFTTETQRHIEILNGWMPPHPTLFLKKEVFEKYGLYRTDMKIASDYEMILRLFFKHKITSRYLPITTYCMTIGGMSNKSFKNILRKSYEDYNVLKMHGLPSPFKTLLLKNLIKLPQFFRKNI